MKTSVIKEREGVRESKIFATYRKHRPDSAVGPFLIGDIV